MRNLTHERQLAYLKRRKTEELALVPATETVVASLPKRDAKGNVKLASDGLPEFIERRMSKRDFLAAEHDDRIRTFAAQHGLSVN